MGGATVYQFKARESISRNRDHKRLWAAALSAVEVVLTRRPSQAQPCQGRRRRALGVPGILARETADFAAALSPDPTNLSELKLRLHALSRADEILSSPKRPWDKDLKKRIAELRKEKFIPKGAGK